MKTGKSQGSLGDESYSISTHQNFDRFNKIQRVDIIQIQDKN